VTVLHSTKIPLTHWFWADEFVFRHNRRKTPVAAAFQTLLGLGTGRKSTMYAQIRGAKDLNHNPLEFAE
jgi:hypothetical protein